MSKTAIYLSGGGARGAYQVGIIKAIAEITRAKELPFDLVCGTSAGAFNAAALAMNANNFAQTVAHLEFVWQNFTPEQVYHTGMHHIIFRFLQFAGAAVFGAKDGIAPRSLLNNTPLKHLIARHINFAAINDNIEQGYLDALSITATSYEHGKSTSFYQSREHIPPWQRAKRLGVAEDISINHLMASSAIPFVFPAVAINHSYYGDGVIRQYAPLSTPIHLGANKILTIGLKSTHKKDNPTLASYPQPAQISSYLLDSLFIDALDSDIERIRQVNELLSKVQTKQAAESDKRIIDVLQITPSQDFNPIATKYLKKMPASVRYLLHATGEQDTQASNSSLLSYLMFYAPYTCELINIGYEDGLAHAENIQHFFSES